MCYIPFTRTRTILLGSYISYIKRIILKFTSYLIIRSFDLTDLTEYDKYSKYSLSETVNIK